MKKEFEELLNMFKKINKMVWIKGINNNTNGVGSTFENLINKKVDSCFMPDYKDIEIKCSQRYSRYPISLFSCSFDGPQFKEMNYLVNNYGVLDKTYNKKILHATLYLNKMVLINDNYYFKLVIRKEKMILEVYNINKALIDNSIYVNLSTLNDHLTTKISNLALIFASNKVIDGNNYFRYYRINFYTLKSYEKFIELLNNREISIYISYRIGRSGRNAGKYKNKPLIFQLPKGNIKKLFDKVYDLDCDDENTEINNFEILD